jgi:hypothetical protein
MAAGEAPSPAALGKWSFMDDLVTWLDAHSGGVQAIATLVLVGITWRYVVLTGALARTAQRQLALQEESAKAQKTEAVAELKSLANSMRHAFDDVLNSQSAEALNAVRGEAWMDRVARIEHLSGLAGGPYAVRGVAASTILRTWETKTRKATGGTRDEKSAWERQTRTELGLAADLLRDLEYGRWDTFVGTLPP